MKDYEDGENTNSSEFTAHGIKIGGTSTQPVIEFFTGDGVPKLDLASTGYKSISWKDNGDGTYILIGQ
jgi:hypothetical protein